MPPSFMSPSYTTGKWVPQLPSVGSAFTSEAWYWRISEVVHIFASLSFTQAGAGTTFEIRNLPFWTNQTTGPERAYSAPIRFVNLATHVVSLTGEFNGNTIQVFKHVTPTPAWTPLMFTDLSDTTKLWLSGAYFTDPNEKRD